MHRILAVNPGATSTKIAVFDDDSAVLRTTLEHQGDVLKAYPTIASQFDFRLSLVEGALREAGIPVSTLAAVVGRGGRLKPMPGGTFRVGPAMRADLERARYGEHASNLGALLAFAVARKAGPDVPSFVVDPVSVDEMEPVARLSGHPLLPRVSMSHALNGKAVARRAAADLGKRYEDVDLITVHLGTGISVVPHRHGRMVDVNNALEEGPFSPDRTGGLPAMELAQLCFSGRYAAEEVFRMISGDGGLYAYLGTRDAREAEARAEAGDAQADLVLEAMAYQVAKEVGAMAAVLAGKVDRIVVTGGLARSARVVREIEARVAWIAPVVVHPGEEELEALAAGALRVLRGEEDAMEYVEEKPIGEGASG